MIDMYDKICPLLFSAESGEKTAKCRGSRCAFACDKSKAVTDQEGKITFENDGWYCLVRDFLIAMASGE